MTEALSPWTPSPGLSALSLPDANSVQDAGGQTVLVWKNEQYVYWNVWLHIDQNTTGATYIKYNFPVATLKK